MLDIPNYNDDACGVQSKIEGIPMTAGQTAYAKVYGYSSAFGNYDLEITGEAAPPLPDTISTFPASYDLESGVAPSTIAIYPGQYGDAYIADFAAHASSYGLLLEGEASTGWTGGSTSGTYENAFIDSDSHISTVRMTLEPSNTGVPLFLSFDFRQNYSFGFAYEWFRVLINGDTISDINGNSVWNPQTAVDDPWTTLKFDLSAYEMDEYIVVELQNSGKYYYQYYGGGDVAMIDNISVAYYEPDITWANLSSPDSALILVGEGLIVTGQVFVDGVTNEAGQGSEIEAWIGWSETNTDPATWTNWSAAAYSGDMGDNDEYQVNLGNLVFQQGQEAAYYFAMRYQFQDKDYVYGGYNGGFWDGNTNVSGYLQIVHNIPLSNWSFIFIGLLLIGFVYFRIR